MTHIGFGARNFSIAVYIGNRPPIEPYHSLSSLHALENGEVKQLADLTGNHWRKIFNVYAKLLYTLDCAGTNSWQEYRDQILLTAVSREALLFSRPLFERNKIHIITGRQYANSLDLKLPLIEIDDDFQLAEAKNCIVCPYFDYRQLSNAKIETLADLIRKI